MEIITIFPNNKEEARLYKQLAKQLHNRFTAKKVADPEAEKKKQAFLDEFSESLREMKLHEAGKIKLPTLKEVLDEL